MAPGKKKLQAIPVDRAEFCLHGTVLKISDTLNPTPVIAKKSAWGIPPNPPFPYH